MRHGACGYSDQKCRCGVCQRAWTAYMREYRRRRKAAGGRPLREAGAARRAGRKPVVRWQA